MVRNETSPVSLSAAEDEYTVFARELEGVVHCCNWGLNSIHIILQGEKIQPEYKEMVTVYFSDIVGFTKLSSSIDSSKVTDLLGRLYSKFDELADFYEVHALETIGDGESACLDLPAWHWRVQIIGVSKIDSAQHFPYNSISFCSIYCCDQQFQQPVVLSCKFNGEIRHRSSEGDAVFSNMKLCSVMDQLWKIQVSS